MKFAWKMISLVSVLLALSLAIGGLIVVRGAYLSELDTAISESQEDMKLFGTTLQALCLMENDQRMPEQVVRYVLERYDVLSTYDYAVYDEKGSLIVGGGTIQADPDQSDGVISTRIIQQNENYKIVSSQRLVLLGHTFVLTRSRDVTWIVHRAEDNLQRYELVMLAILLTGILLMTFLTFLLTGPIRKLSRGAKLLSEGQLERRVHVRSSDELGQLARDFNRMADTLEDKIRELEDAAQRQKDFTASFAHELKTPLTSVIGYADTLRSRLLPQRQQVEAANYIFSEGKRLEAMSFALLDLFALERERPEMMMVSASQLANELQGSLDYPMKECGIVFSVAVQPGEVFCAPELLKTMLYNLLDNAKKASKPADRVELRGSQTETGYCFTVIDHGSGIPEEALSRLTEPFYMVDKSRSRAKGGAGLGLALCQKIAEVHGGSLHFVSTLGEGTVVKAEIGGGGK